MRGRSLVLVYVTIAASVAAIAWSLGASSLSSSSSSSSSSSLPSSSSRSSSQRPPSQSKLHPEQAAFLRRLENYEIVQPRRSRAGNDDRVRRRADGNVAYTIEAFGKTFQLELTPNRRLVTAEFAVRRRRQHRVDETTIDIDTSCYHVGRVRGNRGSGAALSSCGGGLRGLFSTNDDDYFIEPLQRIDGNRSDDHVVYRRSSTSSSSSSSFDWQKGLRRDNDARDEDVVPQVGRRRRRSEMSTVETVVYVDDTMTDRYGDDVSHYVLCIMNMVSILYRDASLGSDVNIAVVGVELLDDETVHKHELDESDDAHAVLNRFCEFQERERGVDRNQDNAILLTRRDLCQRISTTGQRSWKECDNLGMAIIGGMCNKASSCGISQDTGLTLSFTVAHEMGHNFGMVHDSGTNGCHRSGKLMAPKLRASSLPNSWSKCSRDAMRRFLDDGKGECLKNVPNFSHRLPVSETFASSMDDECRLRNFTNGACDVENACHMLSCVNADHSCQATYRPLAQGSPCTLKNATSAQPGVCYLGRCVTPSSVPVFTNGSWSEWSSYRECSHACGTGVEASVRQCNNPPPSGGGFHCAGRSIRYRLCNRKPCRGRKSTDRLLRDEQCRLLLNSASYAAEVKKSFFMEKSAVWKSAHETRNNSRVCMLTCYTNDRGGWQLRLPLPVRDGTPCFPGSSDVCIRGRCVPFGCDGEEGSNAKEDACRVCGGNGSFCQTIKRTIKLESRFQSIDKHVAVIRIPKGATNIVVHKKKTAVNYLAVRNDSGYYHLNGATNSLNRSLDYFIAGTTFFYERIDGAPEKLSALGPTESAVHVTLLVPKERSPLVRTQLTVAVNYTYSVEKSSAIDEYVWEYGELWSRCSAKCSRNGNRTQSAHCYRYRFGVAKRVSRKFCSRLGPRPKNRFKSCVGPPCDRVQFLASAKYPCSVTCGQGTRKRAIYCIRIVNDRVSVILNESACLKRNKSMPAKVVTCRMSDCPPEWKEGPWGSCYPYCGENRKQNHSVTCISSNVRLADEYCSSIGPKPTETKMCEAGPKCPKPKWVKGPYGECTGECGRRREKNRTVTCQSYDGQVLDDEKCSPVPKPRDKDRCPSQCVQDCNSVDEPKYCQLITKSCDNLKFIPIICRCTCSKYNKQPV